MPLSSGTKLGVYEILTPIGKGGMGAVCRARDTKLGREVAIKVLPEELSRDRERLARFEREAQLLASLNHPAVAPQAIDWGAVFSPDGKWIAYSSDETTELETWVRSYPDEKFKRQLSFEGGVEPVWCPCGEGFYRQGNTWWAARVTLEPEISWERPGKSHRERVHRNRRPLL